MINYGHDNIMIDIWIILLVFIILYAPLAE